MSPKTDYRNSILRLRVAYLVAICSIAAVSVGSHRLLISHFDEMSNDAVLINVAGRQRMLSQRIAKLSLLLQDAMLGADLEAVKLRGEDLQESLREWSKSHEGLVHRVDAMGLGGINSREIQTLFDEIDSDYDSVFRSSNALVQLSLEHLETQTDEIGVSDLVDQIVVSSDRFLPVMNSIVKAYEDESEREVRSLQSTQYELLGLVLMILAIQVPLVFEPAVRIARKGMEELKRVNEAKGNFLANMSHEIRTPMTAVIGYADLLADDREVRRDDQKSSEAIHTIRRNAKHLLTIINDILDFSKIEAQMIKLEELPVDPRQIVNDVISLMDQQATRRGVELKARFQSGVPSQITSDPTRLRQILLNLVGNAVKFTERGSVVIELECDRDRKLLRFCVMDTGVGMSPEQVARIARFEAFSQGDASTSRNFGGSGLGLSISNALAEMLGGGIKIDSEEGVGSTFTASVSTGKIVDAMENATQSIEAKPAELNRADYLTDTKKELPLEGLHILLVEDGPDNQRLMTLILQKAGAKVHLAENGAIACEQVVEFQSSSEAFDLVVMDMQMPVMDGYTATRKLRDDGFGFPIIAATASAMRSDYQDCIKAGCDDYISKPLNRQEFISLIQKHAANRVECTV